MLLSVMVAAAACGQHVSGSGTRTAGTTVTDPCSFAPAPPASQGGPGSPVIDGSLQAVAAVTDSAAWAAGGTNFGNPQTVRLEGQRWQVVFTPIGNPLTSPGGGEFEGIAATSATDAWAVGLGALIEHWNGGEWSRVRVPGAGHGTELHAVAALTATSAWAVGEAAYGRVAMILRWNGAAWLRQASPVTGADSVQLLGVAATSSTDAWVVGSTYTGSHQAPLIEHWDGARWSVVPSPSIPGGAALAGVAAAGPADAWAVGTSASSGGLVERWDGHSWTVTPSPSMGQFAQLRGVTALTARSAWAVGGVLCPGAGPGRGLRTLTEHWDGRDWRLVPSPAAGILTGVSAASDSSAWAVGFWSAGPTAIIEHWDGAAWTWPTGLCGSPAGSGCLAPGSQSPAPSGSS